MQIWPGSPYPLGATYDGTGTNFALFSYSADTVELCLVDDGPDGTLTDGLDTAIFVLGAEKGLELIERYPGYETIIVDAAGKVSYSQGLVAPN